MKNIRIFYPKIFRFLVVKFSIYLNKRVFVMDDSNSFFSPYKILPLAQENKYFGIFSYFIMELYVVCSHQNRLIEAILMSTLNIQSLCRKSKRFPKIIVICFLIWRHD